MDTEREKTMSFIAENYEVVVIGAGHAGCEAALATARMGHKTLLLTLNIDGVALMPCNPSIGGTAKGHLVREVDALGGEMGRAIDDTFIQSRMLNTLRAPLIAPCVPTFINTGVCTVPWAHVNSPRRAFPSVFNS